MSLLPLRTLFFEDLSVGMTYPEKVQDSTTTVHSV